MMYKTVKGIYSKGVVKLLEKLNIEEGTEAIITFLEKAGEIEDKKLLQRWKSQGLVSSIPELTPDKVDDEPIIVKGKPVSETIIEDRGQR